MPAPNELASQVKIKIDGSDIQQNVMDSASIPYGGPAFALAGDVPAAFP